MVQIDLQYHGQLRVEATHGPSKRQLQTDAPVDNHGKGESFSPTDLVATATSACMITIMGIVAERHGIDLTDLKSSVEKQMTEKPTRRIAKLVLRFEMPAGIPEEKRSLLIKAAETCPVKQSLHPDIELSIDYQWL